MTRRRHRRTGPLFGQAARDALSVVLVLALAVAAALLNGAPADGPSPQLDLQPALKQQAPAARAVGPKQESR